MSLAKKSAFTLIELLIALAVISIFLSISLPAYNLLMQHTQEKTLQSLLISSLQFAQQEALVNHALIALKKKEQKILIFFDINQNGSIQDKTQLIATIQLSLHKGNLYSRSYPLYRDYLQFFVTGLNDNGTFWFCQYLHERPAWALTLNKFGKVRLVWPDKNGVIKDEHNKPFKCE